MTESFKTGASILLVDDDADLCEFFADVLRKEGFHVLVAPSVAQGRPLLREVSLAVIDVSLPDGSGLELLRLARSFALDLDAVMLTGRHCTDTAVEALRLGAVDYLRKPLDGPTFAKAVRRAWEQRRARADLARLTARLEEQHRIASLGRVAAGAAHEINNPVAALISNLGAADSELTWLYRHLTQENGTTGASAGVDVVEASASVQSDKVDGALTLVRASGSAPAVATSVAAVPAMALEVEEKEPSMDAAKARQVVEELRGIVAECLGDARRIAEIVKDMRRLAPGGDANSLQALVPPSDNAVSPTSVLAQAERIVFQQWGKDVSVWWRSEVPADVRCSGEASDLAECLADLVGNGLRAIRYVKDASVRCTSVVEQENVVFLIEDDGRGIGIDDLPHIFDPFYTADRPGEGPGLGLAVVRERIRRMGGTIEVSTLPGLGTEARVVLPLR